MEKIFDRHFLSLATILYLSDSIVHLKGAVLSYRKFSLRPTHLHYLHYTTYILRPTQQTSPSWTLSSGRKFCSKKKLLIFSQKFSSLLCILDKKTWSRQGSEVLIRVLDARHQSHRQTPDPGWLATARDLSCLHLICQIYCDRDGDQGQHFCKKKHKIPLTQLLEALLITSYLILSLLILFDQWSNYIWQIRWSNYIRCTIGSLAGKVQWTADGFALGYEQVNVIGGIITITIINIITDNHLGYKKVNIIIITILQTTMQSYCSKCRPKDNKARWRKNMKLTESAVK